MIYDICRLRFLKLEVGLDFVEFVLTVELNKTFGIRFGIYVKCRLYLTHIIEDLIGLDKAKLEVFLVHKSE